MKYAYGYILWLKTYKRWVEYPYILCRNWILSICEISRYAFIIKLSAQITTTFTAIDELS